MRRMSAQRGAVAVTVAILMVAMVGFTAIAVDAGAIWMDRKELQNSADAAALALAQSCAKGTCETDETGMAQDYADGNKRDENVTVVDVDTDLAAQTVTVVVSSTREHWFAPVIGHDSTQVVRSATASWGGIGGARVLPLTASICHLADITAGSTVTLYTKDDKVDCIAGNPPHAVPAGFGWLDTEGAADCRVDTEVDGTVDGIPGNAGPKNSYCAPLMLDLLGEEILMPIYDQATDTGSNAQYHLVGYAHLRVSAYCFTNEWHGGDSKCTGSKRYVTGTFIRKIDLGADLGGPDYGSTTVRLTK